MHTIVNHPLVAHKLALLRDKNTSFHIFREVTSEITTLLAYEALKNIQTVTTSVTTPLGNASVRCIERDILLVPILRAGLGMMDGLTKMLPMARVGILGYYRDHDSKQAIKYYSNIPKLENPHVIILDPMLATGGSILSAIEFLRYDGYRDLSVISIIAAPEGIYAVEHQYPEVSIVTAAVDERLDENKYIFPGLGDAGDRMFGTL